MADVDVQVNYTTERKVRKTKKTSTSKRRESTDGEVTAVEKENHLPNGTSNGVQNDRYVLAGCTTPYGPMTIGRTNDQRTD